jgi:hypothetical protein
MPEYIPSIRFHSNSGNDFLIDGVYDTKKLRVDSPNLKYKVYKTGAPNQYEFKSFPEQGSSHDVKVYYNNNLVGDSHLVIPQNMEPHCISDHEKRHIEMKNIEDPSKLEIDSKDVHFEVFKHNKNPNTYLLKYNIPDGKIADLDIKYDGNLLENGSVRFVPKEMKDDYENGRISLHNGVFKYQPHNSEKGEVLFSNIPSEKAQKIESFEDKTMPSLVDEMKSMEISDRTPAPPALYPTAEHNQKTRTILFSNVPDSSKLKIHNDSMKYSLHKYGDDGALLKYSMPERTIHQLSASYDGETIKGSDHVFVPIEKKEAFEKYGINCMKKNQEIGEMLYSYDPTSKAKESVKQAPIKKNNLRTNNYNNEIGELMYSYNPSASKNAEPVEHNMNYAQSPYGELVYSHNPTHQLRSPGNTLYPPQY